MTKDQIESVLERVRQWPQDRQEEAVDLLLALEAKGEEVYRPTPEQEAELEEALREIERGEVASEPEVAAAFKRGR
jgi:predicted transcriptional regulator